MDLAHFGLSSRPFRPAPAAELYYPAGGHSAAADRLRASFEGGEGIAVLDGGPGSGKTLTAIRFLDALKGVATPVFIPSARLSRPAELHQAILFDLGKPYQGVGENELRLAVTEHWIGELAAGRRGAIVLDEAHLLSPELLEEIRLLDNLEARGTKAAFVLLVGLPGLRDTLARPGLESLAQRTSCRARLDPLPVEEAVAFLHHQLTVCGGNPDRLLPDEPAGLIARAGRGIPRVLNQLAAESLAVAAAADQKSVDVEAVCEAVDRLGLPPLEPEPEEFPVEPVGSGGREAGEGREPDEPGQTRVPKQKVRKRRVA